MKNPNSTNPESSIRRVDVIGRWAVLARKATVYFQPTTLPYFVPALRREAEKTRLPMGGSGDGSNFRGPIPSAVADRGS